MVEMKREDFISQMIAELARQKAADESAFANPPIRNSMEIFRSLCFDFPTVYSDEISALANAINKIALEKADIDSVGGFSLEEKFLQNLACQFFCSSDQTRLRSSFMRRRGVRNTCNNSQLSQAESLKLNCA